MSSTRRVCNCLVGMWAWVMSPMYVREPCLLYMCMSHVSNVCAWAMSPIYVHESCLLCMCMSHVSYMCAWVVSPMYQHASCLLYRRVCNCLAGIRKPQRPIKAYCLLFMRMSHVSYIWAWVMSPIYEQEVVTPASYSCQLSVVSQLQFPCRFPWSLETFSWGNARIPPTLRPWHTSSSCAAVCKFVRRRVHHFII